MSRFDSPYRDWRFGTWIPRPKPHLIQCAGHWLCILRRPGAFSGTCGLGDTPLEAQRFAESHA